MGIVVALDVHRNQITYKLLDRDTGEVTRGRVAPAARVDVRTWLAQFAGHEPDHEVGFSFGHSAEQFGQDLLACSRRPCARRRGDASARARPPGSPQ